MVAIFFSIISLEKNCDYVKEVNLHLERQFSVSKTVHSSEHICKTQETLRSLTTVVPANRFSTTTTIKTWISKSLPNVEHLLPLNSCGDYHGWFLPGGLHHLFSDFFGKEL